MKYLIVILMLCFCLPLLGQEISCYVTPPDTLIIQSEYSNDIYTLPILSFMEDGTLIIYQNFTIINILSLYDEYEKECYADSSQIVRHFGYGVCYMMPGDKCITPGHYDKKVWIHREPTFQGFIEFSRKKTGGKK